MTESGKRGTGRGKGGELLRAFANRLPSIRRFVWTGRLPFNARASRREEMTATTMTTASTTREFRRASRRNWCSDGEEAKRTEAEERARKSGGRGANVRVLCAYACVRVCVWSVWLENACRTVCVGVACAYHLRSHSSAIYFFSRSKISEYERGEGARTHETRLRPHSPSLFPPLSFTLTRFFLPVASRTPTSLVRARKNSRKVHDWRYEYFGDLTSRGGGGNVSDEEGETVRARAGARHGQEREREKERRASARAKKRENTSERAMGRRERKRERERVGGRERERQKEVFFGDRR